MFMTDTEIKYYLKSHNYEISSHDCIMDILNTSPQIIDEKFDFDKRIMEICTPHSNFKFKLMNNHK